MDLLMSGGLAASFVILCTLVHYEALNLIERLSRLMRRHRWIVLVTMLGLLSAHIFEIWLFGMAYFVAQHWLELGTITLSTSHTTTGDWFDYIYYSAMVYTTVGFGDMVPGAGLRMLTSAEALSGFLLITWSASFTFLQMQRLWRP
jgi:hypothetical protein